ncbi:hypothetical protein [Providencia stuartii]|uniref:hypothetical protein n=1 Tax=Providencia stuartii TaxID=588 RepID=UPI000E0866FE|nr:hypothetical protein [Providencia stuartii]SUC43349.1 Uncharacterised protein [Providencia stuartii]
MKKLLLGVLLTSFVAVSYGKPMSKKDIKWLESQEAVKDIGCNEYSDRTYSKQKKGKVEIAESVFKTDKLFDESKLTCELTEDNDIFSVIVIEKAIIDGKKVEVYHSSSSGYVNVTNDPFDDWSFKCQKDAMTDEVACGMNQNGFTIEKDSNGYRIQIGYEHFPESLAYIRVDKGKPIESERNGMYSRETAKLIVDSLSDESDVTIRYTRWPIQKPVDKKMNMEGFNSAKKAMDILLSSYK